jgi:hypothetical protein
MITGNPGDGSEADPMIKPSVLYISFMIPGASISRALSASGKAAAAQLQFLDPEEEYDRSFGK